MSKIVTQKVCESSPAVPLFAVGDRVKAAHNIEDFAVKGDELEVIGVRCNGWYHVQHPKVDWDTRFMAHHRELLGLTKLRDGQMVKANVSDQTPAALDAANTTDSSSRLSASVLFVLGCSWWLLL